MSTSTPVIPIEPMHTTNGDAKPPAQSNPSVWSSPLRQRAATAGLQLDLNVNLGPELNYPYPLSPPECDSDELAEGEAARPAVDDEVAAGAVKSLENLWAGLSSSTPAARVRCAHEIAQLLASTREIPSLLPHIRKFCATLDISRLTAIIDGQTDVLREQLVLSVITNLSFVGITEQLVATPSVPALVVRSLIASAENPRMRDYALPAAFNLSSEQLMLQALLDGGEIVGAVLNGWTKGTDTMTSKFAQHTLTNLSRYRASEQQRKKLSRPQSAPPKGNPFRMLSGRLEVRRPGEVRRPRRLGGCCDGSESDRSDRALLRDASEAILTPRSTPRFHNR